MFRVGLNGGMSLQGVSIYLQGVSIYLCCVAGLFSCFHHILTCLFHKEPATQSIYRRPSTCQLASTAATLTEEDPKLHPWNVAVGGFVLSCLVLVRICIRGEVNQSN